jgi:hypothetical protein
VPLAQRHVGLGLWCALGVQDHDHHIMLAISLSMRRDKWTVGVHVGPRARRAHTSRRREQASPEIMHLRAPLPDSHLVVRVRSLARVHKRTPPRVRYSGGPTRGKFQRKSRAGSSRTSPHTLTRHGSNAQTDMLFTHGLMRADMHNMQRMRTTTAVQRTAVVPTRVLQPRSLKHDRGTPRDPTHTYPR